MDNIFCQQCGKPIDFEANFCPYCCYPVSKNTLPNSEEFLNSVQATYPDNSKSNSKVKKTIKIISIVLASIMAFLIVIGIFQIPNAISKSYYNNMILTYNAIIEGSKKAEDAGNLISNVWYNSIYEKRSNETDKFTMRNGKFLNDFNDSLDNLFVDEEFSNSIYEIEKNQAEVLSLMKELNNPPKKYEKTYSALKNLYTDYLNLTNAVINPTGSYNSFNEEVNEYDNRLYNSYIEMQLYFEE